MSFYVIGPAPKRDQQSLNQCHDDLDVLNEEDIEVSEVQLNQTNKASTKRSDHHSNVPSTNQSREESKRDSLVVPQFDWGLTKGSKPSIKHHIIDHNCTLPQSPNDQSSHHFVAHYLAHQAKSQANNQANNQATRGHSRTSSRHVTADPSSLFNLMRMIKGQVFEIYTPSKPTNGQAITFTQQTAFIFYDAHQSKLGSVYWSFEKQSNNPTNSKQSDESAPLTDFGYVRVKDPCRSIQLGKVKSVQAGPTPEQQQYLITALPWTNFLTISTPHTTLHISHGDRLVIDQWLICLRDIYIQHDFEIREGQDTRGKENEMTMRSITASTKHFTPLFNAFIDPNDANSMENVEAASVLSLSKSERVEMSAKTFSPNSTLRSPGTPVKSTAPQPKTTACGGCVIV